MTMHLVGPYMTTTNYKPRKAKKKNKRQLAADAKHAKFLRKHGVHPDQLADKEKIKRSSLNQIPDYKSEVELPTLSNGVGNGFAKKQNVYTGDEIVGIATMHKSNAVPIRKDSNAAIEIAHMRR